MRASTSASAWISRRRQSSARLPSAPSIWRSACRRWPCVSAITRSARPSTAVRSSFAVLEGAAGEFAGLGRAQAVDAATSAASMAAITARPPCSCSSATSSPVSLRRPGKPERQRLVDGLARLRIAHARQGRRARRGDFAGQRLERVARARPEMRTTAIAAGGRPEERAKMVSRAGSASSAIAPHGSARNGTGQVPRQTKATYELHHLDAATRVRISPSAL